MSHQRKARRRNTRERSLCFDETKAGTRRRFQNGQKSGAHVAKRRSRDEVRRVAGTETGRRLHGRAGDSSWRDPPPHQVRFVTVDAPVRLEVLDWGGTGRPILFVGCYLTGHIYDDIAPKLTDQFHVYAVTRRGVGASDHPQTGYDPQRRADDILEVIGAFGMVKPILIGNSCGGDILHTLGAQHPDRFGWPGVP
jgi:hypothetical protein